QDAAAAARNAQSAPARSDCWAALAIEEQHAALPARARHPWYPVDHPSPVGRGRRVRVRGFERLLLPPHPNPLATGRGAYSMLRLGEVREDGKPPSAP